MFFKIGVCKPQKNTKKQLGGIQAFLTELYRRIIKFVT